MIDDPVLKHEWYVACAADELEESRPKGVRVLGEDVVLWKTGGQVMAWKDLCIHRGTKLSLGTVKEGCIVCPYHGWEYDQSGQCTRIPANPGRAIPKKARAFPYAAREKYGVVWICLGEPAGDIPEMQVPADYDPAWSVSASDHPLRAKAPRIIENYLDFSHLPFLHGGFLGDPDRPEIEDYTVEKTEDGLVARGLKIWQPDPDGSGVGDYRTYDYFCYRPLIAGFTKEKVASMLAVTPVDEETSVAWLIGSSEARKDLSNAERRKWSELIISQDAVAVESQRPELLPLDLLEELHLTFDRLAIAYRRWLKELGVTYGVA
jgi:phenylpropionate dioxygenase-like ring-hydroxylating dioxygenase large terminal subunit